MEFYILKRYKIINKIFDFSKKMGCCNSINQNYNNVTNYEFETTVTSFDYYEDYTVIRCLPSPNCYGIILRKDHSEFVSLCKRLKKNGTYKFTLSIEHIRMFPFCCLSDYILISVDNHNIYNIRDIVIGIEEKGNYENLTLLQKPTEKWILWKQIDNFVKIGDDFEFSYHKRHPGAREEFNEILTYKKIEDPAKI
jgi:hypothetical protein